ncbi:hypothetical protein ANCCAN_10647 [Ancylostoma caninum]|uniref:C2H2-type domain-containing protein n=1 Tax=Ancylostoma caninum TaxID=29170 RepID=A0A368GG92_ANCCA|nr:hypothetical protein ANCCAN_10647 [Ancylostoma caninum]
MEDTVAKKPRVWNPAVDNDTVKDKLTSEPQSSNAPVDFSKSTNPALPLLIQNYFHLARVQQQRVVEEAMRRGFMPPFPLPTMPAMSSRQTAVTAMLPPPQAMGSLLPSSTASASSQSAAVNPLVQSALGVPIANENCCAICGAAFRLTADLVQHMRNNHRRTRFKRKNEKLFV